MDLATVLKSTPPRIFATVDGALLEDAAERIDELKLIRRPLYRGSLESTGIQLVALASEDEIDQFLQLFEDTVAAVFWSWPGDEDAIYRHLRGLGKVEVPKPLSNPDSPEFEPVLFRHADPASLIRVIKVLTSEQREQFLGQARGIILEYFDHLGVRQLVRMPRDGRILTGAIRVG